MNDIPFWQSKTLDDMTDAEWESLCDGCGQCCLHKLMDEDSDEIYFTNVACKQLNIKTCQCRNYERRFEYEPDCIKLTRENLPTFEWLPHTCAYRLLAEGKDLPTWHPLLTGSKAAMHGERISVRHIAVKESEVRDWEDHIMNHPFLLFTIVSGGAALTRPAKLTLPFCFYRPKRSRFFGLNGWAISTSSATTK